MVTPAAGRAAISVRSDGDFIRATVRVHEVPAEAVLAAFTEPAQLKAWWGGGDLTADLRPGGQYTVTFSQLGQRLTGEVISYQPPASFAFSWAWAHQSDAPASAVSLHVVAGESTELQLEHGPHGADAAGQAAAADRQAGWEYFLPRLACYLAA